MGMSCSGLYRVQEKPSSAFQAAVNGINKKKEEGTLLFSTLTKNWKAVTQFAINSKYSDVFFEALSTLVKENKWECIARIADSKVVPQNHAAIALSRLVDAKEYRYIWSVAMNAKSDISVEATTELIEAGELYFIDQAITKNPKNALVSINTLPTRVLDKQIYWQTQLDKADTERKWHITLFIAMNAQQDTAAKALNALTDSIDELAKSEEWGCVRFVAINSESASASKALSVLVNAMEWDCVKDVAEHAHEKDIRTNAKRALRNCC